MVTRDPDLVLEITFASLVTDWAIKRVIDLHSTRMVMEEHARSPMHAHAGQVMSAYARMYQRLCKATAMYGAG